MKITKFLLFTCLVALFAVSCTTDNEEGIYLNGTSLCPDHKHPHFIDLGLPSGTQWACCNVGAATPEAYGEHYAWGETETKAVYTFKNCLTYEKEVPDFSGNPQYDVATAKWGSDARMPTLSEITELTEACTVVWTTQNGVNGSQFIGPNKNSIFLPAAGAYNETTLEEPGVEGCYWSSTPKETKLFSACYLLITDTLPTIPRRYRRFGLTVRPVHK